MATVPSFRTWNVGEIVTAAYMNANIRDAGNFMIGQPIAMVYQGTAQSIANGTFVSLTFDSSLVDSDGGHSNVTNNSRYTGKTPGWFQVSGGASLVPNATGVRGTSIAKNGAAVVGGGAMFQNVTASFNSWVPAKTLFTQMNGTTDFVELQAFQSSGGALNTDVAGNNDFSSLVVRWVHS